VMADGSDLLLDGRGRLHVMEDELGWQVVEDGRIDRSVVKVEEVREGDVDPWLVVLALNVQRRHMTQAAKHKVIKILLERSGKSKRQIAAEVGVGHATVNRVEQEMGDVDRSVHVDETRTDTLGRQQPARKARPAAPGGAEMDEATLRKEFRDDLRDVWRRWSDEPWARDVLMEFVKSTNGNG